MTVPTVAIAQAVAAKIEAAQAAGSLSQQFDVERSYADWELDLTKTDSLDLRDSYKLHVDIVSHTTEQAAELSSRTSIQFIVPIDIAIRRKLGPDKQSDDTGRIAVPEVDALMELVHELHVLLTPSPTKPYQIESGIWQSTQIIAAPVREHLRELRQFTGIVRVTFRADVKI